MTVTLTISFQRYNSFSIIRNIICLGFHQLVKVCTTSADLDRYNEINKWKNSAIITYFFAMTIRYDQDAWLSYLGNRFVGNE